MHPSRQTGIHSITEWKTPEDWQQDTGHEFKSLQAPTIHRFDGYRSSAPSECMILGAIAAFVSHFLMMTGGGQTREEFYFFYTGNDQ
jgi:hypothetical protein